MRLDSESRMRTDWYEWRTRSRANSETYRVLFHVNAAVGYVDGRVMDSFNNNLHDALQGGHLAATRTAPDTSTYSVFDDWVEKVAAQEMEIARENVDPSKKYKAQLTKEQSEAAGQVNWTLTDGTKRYWKARDDLEKKRTYASVQVATVEGHRSFLNSFTLGLQIIGVLIVLAVCQRVEDRGSDRVRFSRLSESPEQVGLRISNSVVEWNACRRPNGCGVQLDFIRPGKPV